MTKTEIIKGKVKTVFTTDDPNKVLIQYENKVTAGNGRKELFLEDKGRICCEISSIIFQKLEKVGIKTHYLDTFPERIMTPLVEFHLKDDSKDDPLLTYDRMKLMGYDPEEFIGTALQINRQLIKIFFDIGFDLVDFKIEFGDDSEGNLLLADEISPDSCRLWKTGTKENFDKDLFRNDNGDIISAYTHILNELRR